MSKVTVFFNAIRTEHGSHLFAAGCAPSAGYALTLKQDSNGFVFSVAEPDGPAAQVISPFELSAPILDDPKSVNVVVDGQSVQVQVYGVQGVASGMNTAGDWVEA